MGNTQLQNSELNQGSSEFKNSNGKLHKNKEDAAGKEEVYNEVVKLFPNQQKIRSFVEFTLKLMYKHAGCGRLNDKGADDFFQITHRKILRRIRKWYKSKWPEFRSFFISAIVSEIRNERDKIERNKNNGSAIIIPLYDYENKFENSVYDNEQAKDKSNWEFKTEEEKAEDEAEENYINMILDLFHKDSIERKIVLLRIDGTKSNQKIAEIINEEVSVVENTLKRIKRKINKFLNDQNKQPKERNKCKED